MDPLREGTLVAKGLTAPAGRSFDDPLPIRFAPVEQAGVRLEVRKEPDGTLTISGTVHGHPFSATAKIPRHDEKGLNVALPWNSSEARIFVGGATPPEEVALITLPIK